MANGSYFIIDVDNKVRDMYSHNHHTMTANDTHALWYGLNDRMVAEISMAVANCLLPTCRPGRFT